MNSDDAIRGGSQLGNAPLERAIRDMTVNPTDDGTTFIVNDIDTTAALKKLAKYEERERLVQALLETVQDHDKTNLEVMEAAEMVGRFKLK